MRERVHVAVRTQGYTDAPYINTLSKQLRGKRSSRVTGVAQVARGCNRKCRESDNEGSFGSWCGCSHRCDTKRLLGSCLF
jgi:hypothetical protein